MSERLYRIIDEKGTTATSLKGTNMVAINTNEYERLKADSKRLDAMDGWTLEQWDNFYYNREAPARANIDRVEED